MLPDNLVHVQFFGLNELATAEREQLPGQPGGAFGGLNDLFGRFSGRFTKIGCRQQRGMPLNDGENVVEIMRDTARELADGLHLLRLAQLFLQLPLGCDIAKQAQHQQRSLVKLNE